MSNQWGWSSSGGGSITLILHAFRCVLAHQTVHAPYRSLCAVGGSRAGRGWNPASEQEERRQGNLGMDTPEYDLRQETELGGWAFAIRSVEQPRESFLTGTKVGYYLCVASRAFGPRAHFSYLCKFRARCLHGSPLLPPRARSSQPETRLIVLPPNGA
jgi:hypothetical protein